MRFDRYQLLFDHWLHFIGLPLTKANYVAEIDMFDAIYRAFGEEFFQNI